MLCPHLFPSPNKRNKSQDIESNTWAKTVWPCTSLSGHSLCELNWSKVLQILSQQFQKFAYLHTHPMGQSWVEGPENSLFSLQSDNNSSSESQSSESGSDSDDSIPTTRVPSTSIILNEIICTLHTSDDIAMVRAMDMNVDDDNEPAVENMPSEEEAT